MLLVAEQKENVWHLVLGTKVFVMTLSDFGDAVNFMKGSRCKGFTGCYHYLMCEEQQ